MNNEPAFPIVTPDMPVAGSPGMAIRDYFAAAALQGMLAGVGAGSGWFGAFKSDAMLPKSGDLAVIAYGHADAMLAHRSKSTAEGGVR